MGQAKFVGIAEYSVMAIRHTYLMVIRQRPGH